MTDHIQRGRPVARMSFALCIGLAAASLAATAQADPPGSHGNKKNVQQQAHGRPPQHQHWQQAQRYDDRYRRPDVYYTAPPVVYAPPGYYQQQGPTVIFSFPLLN